jgi:hypothetical protein
MLMLAKELSAHFEKTINSSSVTVISIVDACEGSFLWLIWLYCGHDLAHIRIMIMADHNLASLLS